MICFLAVYFLNFVYHKARVEANGGCKRGVAKSIKYQARIKTMAQVYKLWRKSSFY